MKCSRLHWKWSSCDCCSIAMMLVSATGKSCPLEIYSRLDWWLSFWNCSSAVVVSACACDASYVAVHANVAVCWISKLLLRILFQDHLLSVHLLCSWKQDFRCMLFQPPHIITLSLQLEARLSLHVVSIADHRYSCFAAGRKTFTRSGSRTRADLWFIDFVSQAHNKAGENFSSPLRLTDHCCKKSRRYEATWLRRARSGDCCCTTVMWGPDTFNPSCCNDVNQWSCCNVTNQQDQICPDQPQERQRRQADSMRSPYASVILKCLGAVFAFVQYSSLCSTRFRLPNLHVSHSDEVVMVL